MKCLPRSKVEQAEGNVLHDSHAEVLAVRAFNRFLVEECQDLAYGGLGRGSRWLRWRLAGGLHWNYEEAVGERRQSQSNDTGMEILERGKEAGVLGALEAGPHEQPFCLRDDISIHMFASEAPCGDASMELTMAEQEDATPWTPPSDTQAADEEDMLGRGHFDRLGIVRRKPSRPDAPLSWSKSCSDKLAMRQCTSLLSSITSRLVWPGNVYLTSLVLPESQYVPVACERAFGASGRMAPVAQKRWEGGFAFCPFTMQTTSKSMPDFAFSERAAASKSAELVASAGRKPHEAAPVASNLSALYTPRRQECLINGLLEGRKFPDPRGASCVSRRTLWKTMLSLAVYTGLPSLNSLMESASGSYADMKRAVEQETCAKRVKADVVESALKGWRRNDGDEGWGLSADERREIGV